MHSECFCLCTGAQASRAVQLHRGRPPLPGRRVPPSTSPRGSLGTALVVDGGGLSGVAATLSGTSHVSGNSDNLLRQHQELSSEVAAAGFATSDPQNSVSPAARASHALSAAASAGAIRATATRSAARETAAARRGSAIAANTDSARGRRVGSSRSSSATRNRSLAASGAAVRVREASGGSGTGDARATPQRVFSGRISQPTTGAGEHRVASASQNGSARLMGLRPENATASVSGTHSEAEVPLVTSSNAHS